MVGRCGFRLQRRSYGHALQAVDRIACFRSHHQPLSQQLSTVTRLRRTVRNISHRRFAHDETSKCPDICTAVPAENVVQRYATAAEISTHGESSPGQYVAEVRTQRHLTTQVLYGSSSSVAASQARPLCCNICTFDVTRHLIRILKL